MSKLKSFFKSKPGALLSHLLACGAGAAAQALDAPWLAPAIRGFLELLGG